MTVQVVVIGAGVVGAAVALGLAERGADVTVLEAGRPGAGTSGTSFAWVNSANKEPEHYHALNHAGVRAHHELAGDRSPWFFPTGNLEWAVTGQHRASLAARLDRLTARGYPAQRLTAEQARELEPDLMVTGEDVDFAFFPEEGHVLPLVLLGRLLGDARDRGVRVRVGSAVVEIERTPTGAVIGTADGARYAADVVVSCTGRWTGAVAGLAGADVPMVDTTRAGSAAVGLLAATEPVAVRLSRVLTGPQLNVRPDGGGRLLLQGLDLDARADPAVPLTPGGVEGKELLGRLAQVLRSTADAEIATVRLGQRALPGDGLTVAGFTDGDAWFYVVATHSGITLAPLLRRLVAGEVFGEESGLLTEFRPGRFGDGQQAAVAPARQPGEQ
ncbi:FAD-binding oxidoreductase [Pseudonocardia alaniniphila]